MTFNKEILENAAKAMRISGEYVSRLNSETNLAEEGILTTRGGASLLWNPLINGSHALEIMAEFEISPSFHSIQRVDVGNITEYFDDHNWEKETALKVALTKYAADIPIY